MIKNVNKNKVFIGIIVILIVALVVVFFVGKDRKEGPREGNYSVVYMTSGEVYIGKLKVFPRLILIDSYLFQVVKDSTDPNKSNFQLQPLSDAMWAPKKLILNKDNIIFYGPIKDDSKIVQTLVGRGK